MRGAVASWLVRSTPERAVWVRALAEGIVLCSWARHLTLTVPLSTQVYKGVAREWSWGARDPPPLLCKPFCKQTTHNIQVTIW